MSKSEYRAAIAATGGYDPDMMSAQQTLVEGVIKVLKDFTRKLEVIQESLKEILKSTEDLTKSPQELNSS